MMAQLVVHALTELPLHDDSGLLPCRLAACDCVDVATLKESKQ